MTGLVNVLIASPLEAEHVARIASVDPRLNVIHRPELLGTARYAGDHYAPISRTSSQEAEWSALLAEAEVMFDVDQPSVATFVERAPKVRWIQSTSSGVGEWIRRLGIVDLPITVTNAAGIHSVPLAEFVIFAMLYFAKRWPRMAAEQRAHHWERCAIDTVAGKTLGVIGLGHVGQCVAERAGALGARVVGLRRAPSAVEGLAAVYGPDGLCTLIAESDYVCLSVPHTSATVGLIGASELAAMKSGAVLINVARGTVVDEPALIAALQSGHLGGAALDVVAREPLPAESPLWDMPNVIITPHSISTAVDENARLTDLFCDNLRRYLDGQPLRNVVDKKRGY